VSYTIKRREKKQKADIRLKGGKGPEDSTYHPGRKVSTGGLKSVYAGKGVSEKRKFCKKLHDPGERNCCRADGCLHLTGG